MIQPSETNPSPVATQVRRHWLRVLIVGAILFVIATVVLFLTGNPNLYPTVILVGNFLIPVVFVAFLYDHQHLSTLSFPTIAMSFVLGGVLGVLGASILEPLLLPAPTNPGDGLTLTSALMIGLIEEGCKIVAVIWLARHWQHTQEMDGLLLGAAAGMGFAALESTGYAFTTLIVSQGQVSTSIIETVLRGLLAPFGHGAWTAILGAVLFRTSGPHRFRLTGQVLLTYLLVVALHGLWDGLPRVRYLVLPPGLPVSLASIVLNGISVILLMVLYRQSLHQRMSRTATIDTT
jgi:RsiW-degrading membrane proteinase PrsW (M82 family)